MDANSSGGPFVSDHTQTFSIATSVPFLESGNSHLFFGGTHSGITFQSLEINIFTTLPESQPTAWTGAIAVVAAGLWRFGHRQNRRDLR